jgi:acyl-CoA synthetase (AMP-forming)/AMP-acid ligase II
VTYLRAEEHRRAIDEGDLQLLESCGRPSQHADVAILDEDGAPVPTGEVGEVCVRSSTNTVGYHNLPTETAELFHGEWLRTGDLARKDDRGYIYLVDRRKFMIISGGYNVYPVVIENVLSEHEAVREISVFGTPHPEWGEAVTAVISLKPGKSVSSSELVNFVRPKLGKWELPKHIEIVEDLPKGVTGKIDKFALRQEFRNNLDRLPWTV